MAAVVIGIFYGLFWHFLYMLTGRYLESKINNLLITGIAQIFISSPILISVIFFKSLTEDWNLFIQVWFFSFLIGALLSKFTIAKRFAGKNT